MSNFHHPFRDAELRVFKRIDGEEYVARFHPYKTYPIIFTCPSEEAVRRQAEEFRADAIEKHEADYIRRREAGEQLKARRKKKEVEVDDLLA